MNKLSVTNIINQYRVFDQDFWLSYKTLEKIHPNFDNIKMSILKAKRIVDKHLEGIDLQIYETEKALLKAEWDAKNKEAKENGSNVHEMIRNMFCTDLYSVKTNLGINTEGYQVQDKFLETESGIFNELRVEIPLSEDYLLVGIIDCVIKNGNNLEIIEWKTDEKISFKSIFEVSAKHNKKLKYPLSALDDCSGIQYQIQLSLYAYMLQQLNPDFIIDKLRIIQIKDLKKKKEFEVEYLKTEVEKLIKYHLKSIHVKEEMNKCNTIKY